MAVRYMGATSHLRSFPYNKHLNQAFSQRSFSILFFQIFARRAKIWKNKSLHTLLPQANAANEEFTA